MISTSISSIVSKTISLLLLLAVAGVANATDILIVWDASINYREGTDTTPKPFPEGTVTYVVYEQVNGGTWQEIGRTSELQLIRTSAPVGNVCHRNQVKFVPKDPDPTWGVSAFSPISCVNVPSALPKFPVPPATLKSTIKQ